MTYMFEPTSSPFAKYTSQNIYEKATTRKRKPKPRIRSGTSSNKSDRSRNTNKKIQQSFDQMKGVYYNDMKSNKYINNVFKQITHENPLIKS